MSGAEIQSSSLGKVMITGVTGYIGGRLLKCFVRQGSAVRCLARHPGRLRAERSQYVEVFKGDVLDKSSLIQALKGVGVAYYLVHSMGASSDFVDLDREGARNFAEAAATCGVKRIVYLGGLGEASADLSEHLQSRQEVGEVLRRYGKGVQVIEFRSSIVIGSGSLSFELIRSLSEKLPIMLTPKWTRTLAQPIAIDDLLQYLIQAFTISVEGNPIFEIGGGDVVSYSGIMQEYCRQRHLKRLIIPVPVLTPWLSSLWLGLITPIFARVGRKLIESIRYETVVKDPSAANYFSVKPVGVSCAIALALRNEDESLAATRWYDALSSSGKLPDSNEVAFGRRLVDSRSIELPLPTEEAFALIRKIGGETGWYYGNWLWKMRGAIDLLFGGVGMRRGRRDPEHLFVGDVVDFWRVEAYEPGRHLRMFAEMKLPGRAWIDFYVEETTNGNSKVTQMATFDPLGLFGILYWYLLYPLHHFIFTGMLRGIKQAALQESSQKEI